ncbi:hypothetical protein G7072_18255 [Nocardioides sp. HDW12B]|uniref:hypothetical protein n=1 Tax=Nocardioides sp. HDW12B TaxID=2714939 RepID=UPI0014088D39|nr:hypothetical protein [Nocardioides sp. HDW12B]QIK68028.1 hypothetical protein G7072_18255 [Nocardioides sp. HDW12B]
MIRRLLVLAPLLLTLAACGDDGEPAGVAGMRLMDGGRVEVVVESGGSCVEPGPVELEESRTEVTVAATTLRSGGDCTDEGVLETTKIRLTSPIGDRAVVDASTGDEVPYVVCEDEPEHPLCDV